MSRSASVPPGHSSMLRKGRPSCSPASYTWATPSPAARAAARIFSQTADDETRRLCLGSLYRIDNETAKKELLRIYQLPDLDPQTRLLTAEFLRRAVQEEQRIAPADAKAIASVIGQ